MRKGAAANNQNELGPNTRTEDGGRTWGIKGTRNKILTMQSTEITEIINTFRTEGNEGNEGGEPGLDWRLDEAADVGAGFLSRKPNAAATNRPFP
jgi:hypothetical protein